MVIVLPLLTVSRFHIGCGGVRIFAAMVGILLNSCSQRQNSNDSRLSHLKDQRSYHNLGAGLCLEEQFGAAASASGEKLLENDATGLDTGALSADRTILQPPPPVVYCSRWIEQR